jgi:NAD+ synthase
MTDSLVIGVAQLNPTVGDISGNPARIRDARAACAGCICLFAPSWRWSATRRKMGDAPGGRRRAHRAVQEPGGRHANGFSRAGGRRRGATERAPKQRGVARSRRVVAVRYKHELSTRRLRREALFTAGPLPDVIEFRGAWPRHLICETCVSTWRATRGARHGNPVVPNGSLFERGRVSQRIALAKERVRETGPPPRHQSGRRQTSWFDGGCSL